MMILQFLALFWILLFKMQGTAPKTSRIAGYRTTAQRCTTLNSFVYIATNMKSAEKFILKLIPLNCQSISHESIQRECYIQMKLSHPYIMPIIEVKESMGFKIIVMKYAQLGSIKDMYEKKYRTPVFTNLKSTAKIMFRILLAIQYLHNSFILHGDIKPGNIVLSGNEEDIIPQIIDFGFAQEIGQTHFCHCTRFSPDYAAPEQLLQLEHSFAADIYSVGATFKYMVTGENPVKCADYKEMAKMIQILSYDDIENQSLRELIRGMMRPSPEERLDIESCIHADFFVNVLGENWVDNEIRSVKPQTEFFIDNAFTEYEDCDNNAM